VRPVRSRSLTGNGGSALRTSEGRPTPAAPSPVLLDATGQPVGPAIDIAFLAGTIDFVTTIISLNGGVLVRFTADDVFGSNYLITGDGVYFDAAGCAGGAWIAVSGAVSGGTGAIFAEPASGRVVLNGDRRELWAGGGNDPAVLMVQSHLLPDGRCQPSGVQIRALPAEVVDDDLFETFPPPYTLEL
jgi:hypothetical protein